MRHSQQNTEEPCLQAVKQVLLAFSAAHKKRNLYSASHTVYRSSLDGLKNLLDDYIGRFGNLGLRIDQHHVLFDNSVVYEGTAEPTDIVFILHRDGIMSMEFREGLELWELDTLLTILHDHTVLAEDAEDDIVTALWKFNLPSILYEAADLELGPSDVMTVLPPPAAPDEDEDTASQAETTAPANDPLAHVTDPIVMQKEVFQLTPDEREQLRRMVVEEEQLDGADYVIDVLLFILEKHSFPEDVDDLLGTLFQELHDTLLKGRFAYLHTALIKLAHHLQHAKAQSHWSAPHLERFYASLSRSTLLNGLLSVVPPLDECSPESYKELKKILLMLGHDAIGAIGPLMLKTSSAALQRIVLETIATLARRDFAPLGKLILEANSDLAGRLVFVLGYLKDEASRQMLSELLRHDAAAVRRQALKAISARESETLEDFFPLIDDPDEGIRKMVLQRLGRERNARVEKWMLEYLQANPTGIEDDDHYLALCRTLGRCGTDRSIPFLKRQLFRWPFLGVLRAANARQRRGAVTALEGLNTKRAAYMIQRSNRGFWGNFLRSA